MSIENHLYVVYLKRLSANGSSSRDIDKKAFSGSSISDLCDNIDEILDLKVSFETELHDRLHELGHGDLGLRLPEDKLGLEWDIKDNVLRTFTSRDELHAIYMSDEVDMLVSPQRTDGGGFTIIRLDRQSYAILSSGLEVKQQNAGQ